MHRRHRFTPSKRKEEPIKHREVPSSLYGWVTLQLTRDPTFARGFLSARSVTGFLSDVYSVAADEVGKIFVIADERADLSKPETIPVTLVGIHTVIDCATGRPEEPIKTRMSSSDFESPKKTSKNTQSPSSTRGVKRKCIGETSKWNKVPQYMISQTKRFGTKVQPFNDLSVISDLNTTFTNKQKELFKATPFGHFLKFPKDLKFQAQLVHHIILREVYSMSEDVEFWFKINGTMVRFSIEEFSLITGLKCHGNDDDSIFVEKDESLRKVLFKESKGLITKKEVRNAFIRKRAKGDVNMVKLGLVHFLANFLFGTVPETKVSNFFWNIVDSDDATFQQFPYGKLLWEKSRHSMRLSLMKKEEIFEKMFDEETGKVQPYSYKLFGFPYAFLIWIFETIPALSPTFCEKLEVVQLLPKESEKESETLKEFSFQPKFMFREAPQTDVQPLTEIPILRPSTSVPKAKEKSPVMETKNYNAEFKKLDKRMKDILSNQKNIHGELVIFNQNFKDFCKILSEYTRSTPSGTSNVDKCVLENDVPLTKKDKIEHSLSGHEVVPGNVHADDGYVDPQNEELEGKKLMGALVIEDHDCTDEVVDAAYSGFSAAMKFIQKSKGEGAQITKNEEPHTPFVVVSPDLKSTTEKAKLSTENMVDLEKREPKPSAIFQSPFVTDFGSSEPVPVGKRKNLEIVKGIIPFRKEIGKNATTEETQAYNDWYFEGYKPNTKNKFVADANDIDFDFGIMHIKKKYWFYQLQTCGQFLSDSHIDVIMYYLRKKIMHSGTINLLVTTTDSIFYKVVRTTYESYLANGNNVINQESIIAKYMSGQSLSCSVPWYYLDHVAIPAHVTDEVHYILAHFNIRERCLVVYNSMTPRRNKKPVEKTVTAFSVLIPLFMECIGFYNTRADIDFNQGPYAVARSHPLAINDCGAFVIAFADHIIHDTINGISPKLNIANYRDDLAVCLYHHAKKKQEDGYKTDVEEPEKPEKTKKKTDVEEPEKPEKEKKKNDAEAPEKTEKKKKKDVEEAPRKLEKKKRKVVQEAPEKPEKKKMCLLILVSVIKIGFSNDELYYVPASASDDIAVKILLIFVIGGCRIMNNKMKNDNHTRGEGKKSDENRKKLENSLELLCRT
ncbi:hypothetical protein G4B88_016512 [Cannabis sativa]|uniref:Ubiquitin-like protease family profile domain-containing protein n=1 Tax=Cannabis sativa TaxID=3483 RepID=A0A7J6H7D0_CANSA|nr:hypothetical protein G4B88_016512 [Cannabis sativa]